MGLNLENDLPWRSAFQDLKAKGDRFKAPAQALSKALEMLEDIALKSNITKGLQQLGPQIETLLEKNIGVLIEVGYDEWTHSEGQKSFEFHYVAIASAGGTADAAYSQRPSSISADKCSPTPAWCKSRRQYFWYTRFGGMQSYLPPGAKVQ